MDYNGIISDLVLQLVGHGRDLISLMKNESMHQIIKNRLIQQKIILIDSLLKEIKDTKRKSDIFV